MCVDDVHVLVCVRGYWQLRAAQTMLYRSEIPQSLETHVDVPVRCPISDVGENSTTCSRH